MPGRVAIPVPRATSCGATPGRSHASSIAKSRGRSRTWCRTRSRHASRGATGSVARRGFAATCSASHATSCSRTCARSIAAPASSISRRAAWRISRPRPVACSSTNASAACSWKRCACCRSRRRCCVQTESSGEWGAELSARASWCLDEREAELTALIRGFVQATPKIVQKAVQRASSLAPIEPCDDRALLERRHRRQAHRSQDIDALLVGSWVSASTCASP